jgi:hypothetical protein
MPTSEDRGRVVSILLHIWEILGQHFSLGRGYSESFRGFPQAVL